jgi:CRP-like cAMP-binding protein
MEASRVALLQQMPLFGGIREDVLAFLVSVSRDAKVAGGEFFFREGEAGESMFVLESGTVDVIRNGSGPPVVLCTLGAGDSFGEMALIDLGPRSASVRAVEDCSGFEIFAGGLFALYERDLEQFALIQMNMARELSRRLRRADDRLLDVLQHPPAAPERAD